MENIIQLLNYSTYKEELRQELQRQADSFVRTGYLLRLAMDTDILKDSGYYNVNEFAKEEFNIDASTVSRYININMRFSENGYSERIAEQYQGMGYAKLSLMLLLPDAINEELTPAFSKSEIQAIKEEYDEEKEISDLEVLMEGENTDQKELDNNLAKALHQLGMDEPELFCKLFEIYKTFNEHDLAAGFREALAPQGENIYNVRVKGIGKLMISVKIDSDEVAIINMRSGEKEQFSHDAVAEVLAYFMHNRGEQGSEAWQQLYGMPFPVKEEKKAEIAPVQHKEQKPKKPEPRKQSRVTKTKKPEQPKPEPKQEPEVEEQLPGQDNIMNHQEYLPESMKNSQGADTEEIGDGISHNESSAIQNVTEDTEIVQELPQNIDYTKVEGDTDTSAAVIENIITDEELEMVWEKADTTSRKLATFFVNYSDPEMRQTEQFREALKEVYKNAISVAADLERMINHGQKHNT